MALFAKTIQSMDDLYEHMLEDIYYAEQQILKSLPKMIDKAGDEQLRTGAMDMETFRSAPFPPH